jgi:hypothetical protein
MLGLEALGHLALGQVVESTTAALPAFAGSFTLTVGAATFQIREVASSGSFTLTGEAATFSDAVVASGGGFALTGEVATFEIVFAEAQGFASTEQMLGGAAFGELALGQGVGEFGPVGTISLSFALTGEAIVDLDAQIAACGFFSWGSPFTFLSYDLLGGGGTIAAGTFSRGRWRALQEELAAEREAEQREREEERRRRRAAREAAAAAERERRQAERARIDAVNASAAAERAFAHALAVAAHIEWERAAMQHAAILHALALGAQERAHAQDDEEALALLLAA